MTTAKNPYLVLGITPDLAKKVSVGDLNTLVEKHYRALGKSAHPDRRGEKSTARFREIREAYEALLDPETKKYWLADLKTRKTIERGKARLAELENQLETERQRSGLVLEQIFQLWSVLSSDQAVLKEDTFGPKVVSIFPSHPVSLLIMDTIGASMSARRLRDALTADWLMRQTTAKLTYELIVSNRGQCLCRQSLVKVFFKREDELPQGTRPRWIIRRGGNNPHYYWRPVGDREPLVNHRLIGSLVNTEVFGGQGKKETSLEQLVPKLPGPEDFERVRETGFPWEMFREYAHAVVPVLADRHFLVAVCSEKDKPTVFRLLGRVIQINLLET
ncbi:MAG: J domain-containing protein [Candidatus Vogelbacteria bacterium]|nr:J domain-containing protein [Candidatus Vogelbacteria bacterium]